MPAAGTASACRASPRVETCLVVTLLSYQSSWWLSVSVMPERAPGLGTSDGSSVWHDAPRVYSYVFRLRIPDGRTKILRALHGDRLRTLRGWFGICAWVEANIYRPVSVTDFGPAENASG